MEDKHLVLLGAFGSKGRTVTGENSLTRHCEDAEIQLRVHQPASLVCCHVHTELFEEPKDGTGFHRSWSVVVPGDQGYGCTWQRLAQPLKLTKGENDREVGWADRMEEIAGDHDSVGASGDYAVNGVAEGLGNVGLTLIDACRGLPMVLPDAQVGVRNVGQFHGWRMSGKVVKSKNLPAYPP
jgi:hypothetical protein